MATTLGTYQHLNYEHASFTPVRRPERALYIESPANASHAPWTTARCNRLLRPLSSRIAALQKQKRGRKGRDATVVNAVALENIGDANPSVLESRLSSRPTLSHDDGEDPDWAPENAPKRLKRTYSTKGSASIAQRAGKKSLNSSRALGELSITAPTLNGQNQGSQASNTRKEICQDIFDVENEIATKKSSRSFIRNAQAGARDSFRRTAKSVDPQNWMLYDGLYSSLDALLKATAKTQPRPITGARSLFATCLRKIPDYIALERAWAEEDDEDDDKVDDLTTTIYTELESQGTSQSGGWKPLKEITRAHGISLLSRAIEDGMIHPSIAKGLITFCLESSALEEAELLCISLLQAQPLIPDPTTTTSQLFNCTAGLRSLWTVASQAGRSGFLYRTLSTLLEQGFISVEWMASLDMIESWNSVIASIAQKDEFEHDASAFLRTVVSLSYRTCITRFDAKTSLQSEKEAARGRISSQPSNDINLVDAALTRTISNLVTVLAAVTIIKSESPEYAPIRSQEDTTSSLDPLGMLSFTASHFIQSTSPTQVITSPQQDRALLPILAYLLSSLTTSSPPPALPALFSSIAQPTTGALSSVIISTSYALSRATSTPSFGYMQRFTSLLLSYSTTPADRATLARGVLAAAIEFAEHEPHIRHLDWMLEIEESIERESRTDDKDKFYDRATPAKRIVKADQRFRWEEGIGEWIARTPFVTKSTLSTTMTLKPSTDLVSLPESLRSSPTTSQSEGSEEERDDNGLSEASSPPPVLKISDLSPSVGRKRERDDEVVKQGLPMMKFRPQVVVPRLGKGIWFRTQLEEHCETSSVEACGTSLELEEDAGESDAEDEEEDEEDEEVAGDKKDEDEADELYTLSDSFASSRSTLLARSSAAGAKQRSSSMSSMKRHRSNRSDRGRPSKVFISCQGKDRYPAARSNGSKLLRPAIQKQMRLPPTLAVKPRGHLRDSGKSFQNEGCWSEDELA